MLKTTNSDISVSTRNNRVLCKNNSLLHVKLKMTLSIFYINIQSIRNKLMEIDVLLATSTIKYDLLCFSEHWITNTEMESLSIKGYKLISYFCRKTHTHGGVAVFACLNLECKKVELVKYCKELDCEISGVSTLSVVIVCLYRSPNGNFQAFLDILNELFLNLKLLKKKVLIVGDYNIQFNKNNLEKMQFSDFVQSFDLQIMVSECTRLHNCLDNVLTNFPVSVNCKVIDPFFSDHKGIEIVIDLPTEIGNEVITVIRPITQKGLHVLYSELSEYDWSFVDSLDLNIEQNFFKFITKISNLVKDIFPCTSINYNPKKSQTGKINWFSNKLKNLRENLKFLHDLKQNNPGNSAVGRYYQEYRSYYRHSISSAKKQANDQYLKTNSNYSKAAWNLINEKRGKSCYDTVNSNISPNDFNDYVSSIAGQIINNISNSATDPITDILKNIQPQIGSKFKFLETSFIKTRDVISKMKNNRTKDIYEINIQSVPKKKDESIAPLFIGRF
jgi:exonuclease III